MTEKFSPAVSVIVPVFNAEKYLPVCLESLLIQTFANFEVIVVDDCSTDQSLRVAESYLARFGGRMKIVSLEENTGSGGIPRNVGLDLSRGKYVYFVDNDDFLIDIALETLYDFAQEYRADVVFMEKFFLCAEKLVPEELNPIDWRAELSDENVLLESDNLAERLEKFLDQRFFCSPWSKFLRRDLLVDNAITLPQIKIADDIIWTFKIICAAKKILRISSRLYVHRDHKNSWSRCPRTPKESLNLYLSPLLDGTELFEEFMTAQAFFRRNPNLRLRMLMFFVSILLQETEADLKRLTPAEVYEMVLQKFSAAGSSHPALIACLFVMMNIYKNSLQEKSVHE